MPGYEDVWYYLWKEQRLPVNVDPFDSKLENPEDRARLARIFEQGLDKVVGYALPLRREHYTDGTGAWVSGAVVLPARADVPGPRRFADGIPAAAGFDPVGGARATSRTSTSATPGTRAARCRPRRDRPPAATSPARPSRATRAGSSSRCSTPRTSRSGRRRGRRPRRSPESARPTTGAGSAADRRHGRSSSAAPGDGGRFRRSTAPARGGRRRPRRRPTAGPAAASRLRGIVRTALCTEVRGGVLRIFMPPLRYLEDYLELVAAIEDTAADLKLPVLVEGYTPPHDPRLHDDQGDARPRRDRGQHPAGRDLGRAGHATPPPSTRRRGSCRLGTEKFMLDGRHTGTGGGNHIVVGGATPADSPVPAPARSAPQPARLLAQPPVAVVPVQRHVRRPHQPGPARGRGPQRPGLRAGDRVPADPRPRRRARRGWSTASSATCWSTPPATRTAPSSASTSSTPRSRPTGRLGLLEMRGVRDAAARRA